MRLIPRNNQIVIRPYEKPETSPGGIIIPDSYREDDTGRMWEVVAVGPGKLTEKGVRVPCELKVGDVAELDRRWVAQECPPIDGLELGLYIVNEDLISYYRWRPPDDG